MNRLSWFVLACLAFVVGQAYAFGPYETTWSGAYPNSQTAQRVINGTGSSCALCHNDKNGGGTFNAYGWEIRKGTKAGVPLLQAIMNAEAQNSDGDAGNLTNKAEIDLGTQPGWTSGNTNTLYKKDGTTQTNQPPFPGLTNLDPVVNQAPTADPKGPYAGSVGAPISFDGSASKDDGKIVTFAWNFGDGSSGSGALVTHAYKAAGTYQVTLTVTDDMAATGSAKTSAVVVAGNVAPVAEADNYTTPKNTPLQVALPGVLANDTDANQDALTAKMATAPSNGTLQLMSDGSFLYTPKVDYVGADSFTYLANDGKADSLPATVTISVVAPAVRDIDITAFRVGKRARLGGKKAITAKLVVVGVSGTGGRPATLVGTQGGVVVYTETVNVSAPAGGRATFTFTFTAFRPAAAGAISWELTIKDDDPDTDSATATTQVSG